MSLDNGKDQSPPPDTVPPDAVAGTVVDYNQYKIYCAQPQYSGGSPASHRQFWRGAGRKYTNRTHVDGGGSLLANVFNQFLVHCLNLRLSGQPFTHFAMLHDDIVPQDGWLDILMDDLLEHKADLMSAVVPIKDWQGLTSHAIDGPDEFTVLRRITLSEVFNLPEVFSAEDCGYEAGKLLVNTGCWVMDVTKPWLMDRNEDGTLKCFFTIRDRIRVIKTDDGSETVVADVAPEDWNFSRMIQQCGGKVMATRRVKLTHQGIIPFNNSEPWGTSEYDRVLKHRHGSDMIKKAGHEYFEQAVEVPGWLTRIEGELLARLAKGKTVLEIGSYCGRSTIWMARTANVVFAVDTFDGRGTPEPRNTLQEFRNNLDKFQVKGQVRIFEGTTKEALPEVYGLFDLAFIDGAHDTESVKSDIECVIPKMTPEGMIAFHDYNDVQRPGVTAQVNGLLSNNWEVVDQAGTIVVLRRTASSQPLSTKLSPVTDNHQSARQVSQHSPVPVGV